MDFSFIIVNHNSDAFLKRCIGSIEKFAMDDSYEIIVVQNDNNVPIEVAAQNTRLIKLEKNLGFGNACNMGAKKATGQILFFLNPDTEILKCDFNLIKERLLRDMFGIVAPQLMTEEGTPQRWSFGRKLTPLQIIANNLKLFAKNNRLASENEFYVDWVAGTAFAIKKEVFDNIGRFDENYFMYFEDVDLCLRLRNSGSTIAILPQFKILHLGGQSYTGNQKQKRDYFVSQDYYLKKNFGRFYSLLFKFLRIILRKV